MGRIISFSSGKGGAGKTLCSVNFSAELDTENIYKLFGANEIILELINQYNLKDSLKKYMPREKIKKILKY